MTPQPRGAPEGLPAELAPRHLLRRALAAIALTLVALLAPGLGDVRRHLRGAAPGRLALAVVFEALSCVSYADVPARVRPAHVVADERLVHLAPNRIRRSQIKDGALLAGAPAR
jgi:hypothetical protein